MVRQLVVGKDQGTWRLLIRNVYRLKESLRFRAQKCSVISSCEVWSASNNVKHHSIFSGWNGG